jgi:biopolymer transport protein ExbD
MAPSHRTGAFGLCLGVVLGTGIAGLLWYRFHDGVLQVRIEHDGSGCVEPCADEAHWRARVRGRTSADPKRFREALRGEADRAKKDPKHPTESERQVVIRGSDGAPWGPVLNAMDECAKAGIYKIDWDVGSRIDVQLPRDRCGPGGCPTILEEIRVFMKWDPSSGMVVRKIGNRGMVDSDDELMKVVVQYVQDYGKAGKFDVPLLIDATPDVPWRDVIHVIELCRSDKLKRVEFAAPMR